MTLSSLTSPVVKLRAAKFVGVALTTKDDEVAIWDSPFK